MQKNFRSLDMAIELHKNLLKLHVNGFQKDQLLRASLSVALNLSEGCGRFSKKDKVRFYRIAYASLQETQTLIKILRSEEDELFKQADHLGASVYKLIVALEKAPQMPVR